MTDELIVRLRRVEGQVRGIQRMVTDGARCSDVLTTSSQPHGPRSTPLISRQTIRRYLGSLGTALLE